MKLAFDIRAWNNRPSGVGYYLRNLLGSLNRADTQNYYLVIATRGVDLSPMVLPVQSTLWRSPFSPEQHPLADFWGHFYLPRRLSHQSIDIFHGPAFFAPIGRGRFAKVVTIHDLVPFRFPETLPAKFAWYMRWLIRQVVHRVDHIIAVSENTKNDLISLLNVPASKITVIYEAIDPGFQPIPISTSLSVLVAQKFQIHKKYFLYVGTVEPRKNLITLFRAFEQILQNGGEAYQLVIGGQKGWLADPIYDYVRQRRLEHQIQFLGYVANTDLPLLYQGATAFVYPSLYEGFGLPPLEAMACGIPVITSQNSSLAEVVGAAGLLVEATQVDQLAQAMLELLNSASLRQELSQKSLKRARLFSWERVAQETLQLYGAVVREKSRR